MNNAIVLNENESSSQNSRVILSGQETSSVLTFLAETVNLYNWYLRRGENPRCLVYDATEEAMVKLYEELYKRAKEDINVSLTLRTSVWIFKLNPLDGVYDEGDQDEGVEPIEHYYGNDIDNTNSRLWCQMVQRRQRSMMHNRDRDINEPNKECEELLWGDIYNTTDSSELYENLIMLEREYIEIMDVGNTRVSRYNSDGTSDHMMTLSEVLYNSMNSNREHDVEVSELVPPSFGVVGLELERVYVPDFHHDHDRERGGEGEYDDYAFYADYDEDRSDDDNDAVEVEPHPHDLPDMAGYQAVDRFECPICYEAQQEAGSEGVRTMCGHDYCGPCFWSMMSVKSECGMCRGAVREYVKLLIASW